MWFGLSTVTLSWLLCKFPLVISMFSHLQPLYLVTEHKNLIQKLALSVSYMYLVQKSSNTLHWFQSVPSYYERWQNKCNIMSPFFLDITFGADGRFTHPCQTRERRVPQKFAAAFINCLEWLLWNSTPYFTALWPPTRRGCNLRAFYNINMMPDSSQVHRLQGWMHMMCLWIFTVQSVKGRW